jgi:enoyl-CoA hydratase
VESGTVLYASDGAVGTVTLNRPERLNTLVPPMWNELEEAVAAANADAEVKVIVLKGAGRAFCAGFDFSDDLSQFGPEMSSSAPWDGSRS